MPIVFQSGINLRKMVFSINDIHIYYDYIIGFLFFS